MLQWVWFCHIHTYRSCFHYQEPIWLKSGMWSTIGVLLLGMGVLGDKKCHSMFLEETYARICGNLSKIVYNM